MATEEELDIGDLIIFEELTLDRNNDQSIVPQDGMERIDPKPHVVIFLAPNSSTIHPSPFNVNLKFLDEHMARAADFIIPENVLCEMKGWIRFLFDQVAMDYKVPCYRCGVQITKSEGVPCQSHTGFVAVSDYWTCCGRFKYAPGCKIARNHMPYKGWAEGQQYAKTGHITPPGARQAVVVDCEMGQSRASKNEVIRVTMIDYITEEVLVDSLVFPTAQMMDYNTKFSGVSKNDMDAAIKAGAVIFGKEAARDAVLGFVGRDTIVIGHALNNDFNALHWIHPTIVDTLEIERAFQKAIKDDETAKLTAEEPKEKEGNDKSPTAKGQGGQSEQGRGPGKGNGPLSLKTLSRERLGRAIRVQGGGHDSLEDCRATGDIVKWHVQNGTVMRWSTW